MTGYRPAVSVAAGQEVTAVPDRGRPAWQPGPAGPRWQRLPPNWDTEIVPAVMKRDGYQCQLRWDRCTGTAAEVDHKIAGDDHRLEALQAVCRQCHRTKSGQEGAAARIARYNPPPPVHPALRD